MPPTRRKPSNPAPRAQQTLAFGPNSNKVTKPSLPPTSKKLSQPAQDELSKAVAVETTTPEPEIEDAATQPEAQILSPRTLAIRKHGASKQVERKDVEQEAGRVPDTQIRKYWKGKEDERIAPRVHQQGLSVNEKVLRHFDLSSQYGPCIGIPRMKRWKRAQGLGLKPPVEVLAVLLKEERGKNEKAERAFMDGLLASRYE